MFECNSSELKDLQSQFATANSSTTWNHMRRTSPMLFTENGIAMLSSVLNSERAIEVNISIMRIFTKLRNFSSLEKELIKRINNLESNTHQVFKIIFQKLDDLEVTLPTHDSKRERIGFKKKKKIKDIS